MREIKLRVWEGEKYISLSESFYLDLVGIQYNRSDSYEIESFYDGVVIEQYTGLKNKNGVEVYEGDVFDIGDELIGIVEWEEENARFIMSVYDGSIDNYDKDSMYVENLYIYPFEMMEIIGNIHEGVKNESRNQRII